jgi:transcriptional regulator with XRE-family HTH domain
MKMFQKGSLLQQIGMQLRKLKIENNKTSKEIASLLNITTQAYGNIERGESDICITRLIFLAKYYKKSLSDLIPNEYQSFDNIHEPKEDVGIKDKTILIGK